MSELYTQIQTLIQCGDEDGLRALAAQVEQERANLHAHIAAAPHTQPALHFKVPEPPKPEIYWGMDSKPPNVYDWVYEMDKFFEFCHLQDAQKIQWAVLFLRGWAQTWWHQVECMVAASTLEAIVTWDGFKQAITRQFGGFDLAERARDDLAKLRQTTSVMAYTQRFLEILLRIPSDQIIDSDMKHRFVAGLKPQTQLQVKIANPQTLRDAMNLADRIDRVRPVWGTGRPVPQRTFPEIGRAHV